MPRSVVQYLEFPSRSSLSGTPRQQRRFENSTSPKSNERERSKRTKQRVCFEVGESGPTRNKRDPSGRQAVKSIDRPGVGLYRVRLTRFNKCWCNDVAIEGEGVHAPVTHKMASALSTFDRCQRARKVWLKLVWQKRDHAPLPQVSRFARRSRMHAYETTLVCVSSRLHG